MRKLIAMTLALMLVLSAVAMGYAAPKGFIPPGQAKKMMDIRFEDTEGHWAEPTILQLAKQNMIKGYGNGFFMPNKPVTKLESLVMLYEAVEGYGETAPEVAFDPEEHGLYKGPAWGEPYYAWAWDEGSFGDSTKLFNANAAITRAEFAFYAANLDVDDENFDWEAYENYTKDYDDEDIDDAYAGRVGWMNRFGLMIGDDENRFHGGGALKRAEAAMVMYRLHYFHYEDVAEPWAKISVDEEDGCIASLMPEIEIRFSEYVFDDDEDGEDFTTESAEDVIVFEVKDGGGWEKIEVNVTDVDRTFNKEIWTLEPEDELDLDETYRISLVAEGIFDADGNELKDDAEKTFDTCETYSMTADYDAETEFDEDWLGFEIEVDANDDAGTDVVLVFDFKDLPDWFEIEYWDDDEEEWDDMDEDGDAYLYGDEGFDLEDKTIEFRANIPTPGTYEIPAAFEGVSPEATLFELDIELGRVALAEGSEGEAGNGIVYDLDDGTIYRVTVTGSAVETVYYTNGEGGLEMDLEDAEPLDEGVTRIMGLDNALEYLVEIPLSLEIHDVTESALEDWDFEFEITSTPNDDAGKEVEAWYLFDGDMTLEYKASSTWTAIENDEMLAAWTLPGSEATSEFRIDLDEAEDTTLTVEFRLESDVTVLGRAVYEF